jgi:hypothetical protein
VSITTIFVNSNLVHGEVYSIQHYVIKFVSDLRQVGGFLRVPWVGNIYELNYFKLVLLVCKIWPKYILYKTWLKYTSVNVYTTDDDLINIQVYVNAINIFIITFLHDCMQQSMNFLFYFKSICVAIYYVNF